MIKKFAAKCLLFASIGLIGSMAILPDTNAEGTVPSWIKDIAEWWSIGEISDEEYLDSIEWLINHGIINIAESTSEIKVRIGANDFSGDSSIEFLRESGHSLWITSYDDSFAGFPRIAAPLHMIPDGATITGLECMLLDNSASYFTRCQLIQNSGFGATFGEGTAETTIAEASSTATYVTSTMSPLTLDKRENIYSLLYVVDDAACGNDCKFQYAIITYEIP